MGVIRRHLLDGVLLSDLCDEVGLHPTVYYGWQTEFFEGHWGDRRGQLVAFGA